jgi:hypothetical protein
MGADTTARQLLVGRMGYHLLYHNRSSDQGPSAWSNSNRHWICAWLHLGRVVVAGIVVARAESDRIFIVWSERHALYSLRHLYRYIGLPREAR